MSDLFNALSTTARSLDAHRFGLDVVGQNLANVNTPGYTRRSIVLAEVPPLEVRSAGGGAHVLALTAARTPLLDARMYRERPAAFREAAVADHLAVIEAGFGTPGASLDAKLNEFYDAFATLAGEPGSTTARQLVVIQGQALTQTFADVARRLAQSRRDADLEVRALTDEINMLARRVADLNVAIASAPGSAETLHDQQAEALRSLAALVDIDVITYDGGVNVAVGNGETLVAGENVYALTTVSSPPQGLAQVTSGSDDITAAVTGGRLGGLLFVRDTLVPAYQQRLDELAVKVATDVNALHTAGYDLSGAAGVEFFQTPAATPGAAAGMAMNTAVVADVRLIAAAGIAASGDNQNARAIAALRGGSPSAADGWATLVNTVGTDRRAALAELGTREDVMQQIDALRAQISGVSVDEEAAMMLRFQRAYEANARFFGVVDRLLDVLLQNVG